jgi:hypothetical protein
MCRVGMSEIRQKQEDKKKGYKKSGFSPLYDLNYEFKVS